MRVALSLAVVLSLIGCEPDLGACDMTAAKQLVYGTDGTPYYQGQALVQQSCAGSYCHVTTAMGDSRFGAPHGLDFDMTPLTAQAQPANVSALQTGVAKVRDEAASMYGEIEEGTMPPGKVGERVPSSWTSDGKTPVPLDIRTDAGKETVRNWLACNAPVVAGVTGAPAVGMSIGDYQPALMVTATASFSSVYDTVLKGSCVSCHTAGGPFAAMTPLDFSTAANAYATLVGPAASTTGSCSGRGQLVVPGNCASSLLYQKLAPANPAAPLCGGQMPLGGSPISASLLMAVCDWINAGATQQ